MVDVFISYSRKDKAPVTRLARAIEAEGYDVWWDAELPPHQSYGDVITAKISEAKAAIVVWSPDAAASEWVRAEADMARNQRKLVQTALGDIMPPLPFNQIQYADIGDWQGDADHAGWRKVKASLADLCGKEHSESSHAPAYAPPPPPPPAPSPAPSPDTAGSGPSKWPLLAGLGIGGAAILGALALVMMPGSSGENESSAMADPSGQSDDQDFATTASLSGESAGTSSPPASRPEIPENWILATVEDPDGHSNVRARPATSAAIVGRVQVGETFRARRDSGDWWPVELSDGTRGFVAKRLIRVSGSGAPATGPAPGPQGRRVSCSFNNTAFTYDGPCNFVAGDDGDFTTTSLNGPFLMDVTRIGLDVTAPGQGQLEIYHGDGEIQRVSVIRSTQDRACWEGPKISFCAR